MWLFFQEGTHYKCPYCDRPFLQRCDMKRHTLIHTNEEPFHCSTCGKGILYIFWISKERIAPNWSLSVFISRYTIMHTVYFHCKLVYCNVGLYFSIFLVFSTFSQNSVFLPTYFCGFPKNLFDSLILFCPDTQAISLSWASSFSCLELLSFAFTHSFKHF